MGRRASYRGRDALGHGPALGLGLTLHAVHVRDPYLEQFYNEIYAQGREEYIAHVRSCLEEKAGQAAESFRATLRERLDGTTPLPDPVWSVEVLDGDPAKKLAERIETGEVALVVLGRRRRTTFAALRPRDVAERLQSAGCAVPILVVPEVKS